MKKNQLLILLSLTLQVALGQDANRSSDSLVYKLFNKMIGLTLDTLETHLKFQQVEHGRILHYFELGDLQDADRKIK